MDCEFSERNYEKSLDFELSNGNPFFSPSQNQEAVLGIDSSTRTDNSDFWQLWDPNWLNSPSIPRGVEISKNLWKWRRGIRTIPRFPRMRANVFLQYKIPKFITSNLGKEYSDWGQPYFRYDIVSHQNNALRILEKNTAQSAVVVYASPAFWTYDELIDNCNNKSIISNSNFAKPAPLRNHHRYSYDNSGNFGRRHSKSSKIKKIHLKDELFKLVKFSEKKEDAITLKSLSSNIDDTVEELDGTFVERDEIVEKFEQNFKEKFQKTRNYFLKLNDGKNDDSKYLLNILAFTFHTNLSWFIAS